MTDERRTESGKPTAKARREARLAAALRANLKRRKAAAKGQAGPADSPQAGQEAPPPNRSRGRRP